MSDPVLDWLLAEDNPSVRYQALTTLAGQSPPAVVAAARNAIMTHGPVPKLLALQDADGAWPPADRFYRAKYTGTVWNLILLAELAADPANLQVRQACEFILRHAQSVENGGFAYDMSARTGSGLPGSVIPCLTGNMVYSLICLGYLDDERVQRAISWITTCQRADDGDGVVRRPKGSPHDHDSCFGRHSCHMGVAKALKALAAIPAARRNFAVNSKLDELTEYFLKHHLYKKSHDLATISRPGWLRLGFPLMYQTDILELLDIFAALNIRDGRLDEAIAIIHEKQLPDGKWNLESTMHDRMLVRIEAKGKPSKWITLRARRVLQFYERNEPPCPARK